MSNSDSKCMRFSYLLELYELSACGPTLEIFERSRLDLLKSGSLIRAFDVFAIAFRIYPKGPLIIHISPCFSDFDLSVIFTANGKTAEPEYYRRAAKAKERMGGKSFYS